MSMRRTFAGAIGVLLIAFIAGLSFSPIPASASTDCNLVESSPTVGDSDCDNYTDAQENYLGTNPSAICPYVTATGNVDAWPPDLNHDGSVGLPDTLSFVPYFNQPVTDAASQRHDLYWDGHVNLSDVLKLAPYYNEHCTTHFGLSSGYASNTSTTLGTLITGVVVIDGVPIPVSYLVSWYIGGHVNGFVKTTFYNQTEAEEYIYIYSYWNQDFPDVGYSVFETVTHDDLGPGIVYGSTTPCNYIYAASDEMICTRGEDPFLWINPNYSINATLYGTNGLSGLDSQVIGFTPIP